MPPPDKSKNVVILYKGETVYDSMRVMTDQIGEGLRRLGYRTEDLDLMAPGHSEALIALFQRRDLAFFFGFNAWGADLEVNGRSLYDVTAAPMFKFFLDHPIFGFSRVTAPTTKRGLFSFTCRNQAEFVDALLPLDKQPQVIPHGAFVPSAPPLPFDERDIDILFVGSVVPPDTIVEGWSTMEDRARRVLHDAIDFYLGDMRETFVHAILGVLTQRGEDITDFGEANFARCAIELDRFMQAHLRFTTMSRMKDLPIQVYGNGWENLRDKGWRAQFHPAQNFNATMALTNRAVIALHALPYYYESHERVLNGMPHGAAVLASRSAFFETVFTPDRDFMTYNFTDADLPDRMGALLGDRAALAEMGERGRKLCLASHTWHHRAENVDRLVNLYGVDFPTTGTA